MGTSLRRRGFTVVDLAGAVVGVGLIALAAGAGRAGEPDDQDSERAVMRQKKDSTQVRGIHQAFVIWAQNNKDKYPLLGPLDWNDNTVKEKREAKDTTANIYSVLIFNGFFPPELLVSPAEKNTKIKAFESYQYSEPKAAVTPKLALWDPAFGVDFTGGTGGASYAHLQPCAGRLDRWGDTFVATEAVVSLRGPEVVSAEANEDGSNTVKVSLAKPKSTTLSIFGDGDAWAGNVAYNDNHVEFKRTKLAHGATVGTEDWRTYTNANEKKRPDLFWVDEKDDGKGVNDYLGIFTKAGEGRNDWRAIWD